MTKQEKIQKLILVLKELFPNPKIELDYNNNFQLLIAIIMSAQATDIQVNKINKVFFTKFKTPTDLVKLGEDGIKKEIKSLGLYNSKSRNIYRCSKMLVDIYDSQIPDDIDEIQSLPGVGIKTAKVYLSTVYSMPYLAVDTHVHRVLNLVGIVDTKTPEQTDKEADKLFSNKEKQAMHHRLVLFGRYYLKARSPIKPENIKYIDDIWPKDI